MHDLPKILAQKYPCICDDHSHIWLTCHLASQQSAAMLELVMFFSDLLRVTLWSKAYSLASPIFLKHIPWWQCEKVKDILLFDSLGFCPCPTWPRHATPLLWAFRFSSLKWWWWHWWRSNELMLSMVSINKGPFLVSFPPLLWAPGSHCRWHALSSPMYGLGMWQRTSVYRKADKRWQMVKTWDFILKVKEKTPRSLKQRGGSINHPFTVENGVIWLSRSDLHWCIRRVCVKGIFTPEPERNWIIWAWRSAFKKGRLLGLWSVRGRQGWRQRERRYPG